MKSNPVMLFLHIPKTGGTTLRKAFIYRAYHSDERYSDEIYLGKARLHRGIYYYPLGFYYQGPELSVPESVGNALEREDIRAVTGHFSFGIHRHLGKPSTYVTLLRNPTDRIVSLYYHVRRWGHPDPDLQAELVSKDVGLETFVTQCALQELSNDQTRRVSGLEPNKDRHSKIALRKAKDNLCRYFSVVGLTERFDETLILLKRRFGYEGHLHYYPSHVSRLRPSLERLPPSTVRTIKERNELDIELYRFAKGLMDDAISAQDASFHDEVERFKVRNTAYLATLRHHPGKTTLLSKEGPSKPLGRHYRDSGIH